MLTSLIETNALPLRQTATKPGVLPFTKPKVSERWSGVLLVCDAGQVYSRRQRTFNVSRPSPATSWSCSENPRRRLCGHSSTAKEDIASSTPTFPTPVWSTSNFSCRGTSSRTNSTSCYSLHVSFRPTPHVRERGRVYLPSNSQQLQSRL